MYSPGVSGAQIDPYYRPHVLLRGERHAGPEGQEKREPVQHHADLNKSAIHKSRRLKYRDSSFTTSCSCFLHFSIRTVLGEDLSANFKPTLTAQR